MYTNLILFLVAIFTFSLESVPKKPLLPGPLALIVFAGLVGGFSLLVKKIYGRRGNYFASGYFKAERNLSIVALAFFAGTVYLCDPKYYFAFLSFGFTEKLPVFVNYAGLLLFVLFLAVMWWGGKPNYECIFGKRYSVGRYVWNNFKVNLPIVLPWAILSLFYDVTMLLPIPGLQPLVASGWGDILFYLLFILFVLFFFPPLVRRLWGCVPIPDGPLRNHLEEFCQKYDFKPRFYFWPLYEGRVLTAGVMGIFPKFRYILITPALIETMNWEELEAIIAHEIGHVKKGHLVLYLVLLGSFSALLGLLLEPLVYWVMAKQWVIDLMINHELSMENVLTGLGTLPLLLLLVVYLRYIFGFYIRNFERQADLYSLATIGHGGPLISAFEKIAMLSGNLREERNWHHFGIGERIDCLVRAERNPKLVSTQNRKVRNSLFAYLVVVIVSVILANQLPVEALANRYKENFGFAALQHQVQLEPDNIIWIRLLGDVLYAKKREKEALAAYEKAFSLDPGNGDTANNISWILLTSIDPNLRDPEKALLLAQAAATIVQKGYVLDTLATALWANGRVEEAVQAEQKAIVIDPGQQLFYEKQIKKFTSISYQDSFRQPAGQKS